MVADNVHPGRYEYEQEFTYISGLDTCIRQQVKERKREREREREGERRLRVESSYDQNISKHFMVNTHITFLLRKCLGYQPKIKM